MSGSENRILPEHKTGGDAVCYVLAAILRSGSGLGGHQGRRPAADRDDRSGIVHSSRLSQAPETLALGAADRNLPADRRVAGLLLPD